MTAKRGPTSDLNHTNWDQEEEPEEAGRFKEASEAELKNRVIKKARRQITDSSAGSSGSKNIFGGFTGFGKPSESSATDGAKKSSPFSFLSKIPSATATVNTTTIVTNQSNTLTTSITSTAASKKPETANFTFGKTEPSKDEAYYAKVIKLNQSFCEWIKKHVDEQPLCNLMSTFKDYEKYWEQLKQEKQSITANSSTTMSTSSISSTTAIPAIFSNAKNVNTIPTTVLGFGKTETESKNDNKNGFSFGSVKPKDSGTTVSPSNGSNESGKLGSINFMSVPKSDAPKSFSFGIKTDDKPISSTVASTSNSTPFSFGLKKDATPTAVAAPPFSFGIKTDDKPASTGFSFTPGSAPFSFGNIKPPAAVNPSTSKDPEGEENEDDDDEPPKVEIKEIVEEDAFYTKKCKVFLKKDNAYKDFGIAMLYLKSVQESSKTQLLVRSSALGKILINTLLADATPVQRVGKNNVMIIYPNADGENQTNLIRVKDASEADELLETINKHKK